MIAPSPMTIPTRIMTVRGIDATNPGGVHKKKDNSTKAISISLRFVGHFRDFSILFMISPVHPLDNLPEAHAEQKRDEKPENQYPSHRVASVQS